MADTQTVRRYALHARGTTAMDPVRFLQRKYRPLGRVEDGHLWVRCPEAVLFLEDCRSLGLVVLQVAKGWERNGRFNVYERATVNLDNLGARDPVELSVWIVTQIDIVVKCRGGKVWFSFKVT